MKSVLVWLRTRPWIVRFGLVGLFCWFLQFSLLQLMVIGLHLQGAFDTARANELAIVLSAQVKFPLAYIVIWYDRPRLSSIIMLVRSLASYEISEVIAWIANGFAFLLATLFIHISFTFGGNKVPLLTTMPGFIAGTFANLAVVAALQYTVVFPRLKGARVKHLLPSTPDLSEVGLSPTNGD